MAKKLGKDYFLWVETATPSTYAMIKGQTSLSNPRSASTINTTTKDDGAYNTSAAGPFDWSVDCSGIPDLPDVAGLEFVNGKYKTQTPWKFQIRRGGAAGATPADVTVEALCNILDCSIDYGDKNSPARYTIKLALSTAPTIDLML